MPLVLRQPNQFSPNVFRQSLPYRSFIASTLISGLALTSTAALAQQATPEVAEQGSGTKTFTLPIRVSPRWIPEIDQSEATTCTVYGSIQIDPRSSATEERDFVIPERDFSVRIDVRRDDPNFPPYVRDVYDEVMFEILADNEVETPEYVNIIAGTYGITCDGGAAPPFDLYGVYGSFFINDAAAQQTKPNAIPTRQKSLSAQLNSLRTLSLHNSVTRDRSIAKEIDRARKSSARFRADNLQVSLQDEALPVNGLLGGAAGDEENFGRWGAFVTGNVDLGKQEKNSAIESDFHSNMLIAGVDYKASDNIVLGAAVSHSDTNAGDDKTANTDFRRYSLSLFGSIYSRDRFYLDGMLTYGTSAYDLDRRIAREAGGEDVSTADTDGDELSASVGAGYNVHHNNLNARFFTFINYVDANIDGYAETVNGDSSAAVVDGMDLQSLIANLGLEVSWNINSQLGVFTPTLSIAQEQQYADDSVYVTGNFVGGLDAGRFTYTAPERDDNYMNAQLGLNAVLKNGISVFVSYDTFIDRKDFASSQLSVGARWEF